MKVVVPKGLHVIQDMGSLLPQFIPDTHAGWAAYPGPIYTDFLLKERTTPKWSYTSNQTWDPLITT